MLGMLSPAVTQTDHRPRLTIAGLFFLTDWVSSQAGHVADPQSVTSSRPGRKHRPTYAQGQSAASAVHSLTDPDLPPDAQPSVPGLLDTGVRPSLHVVERTWPTCEG